MQKKRVKISVLVMILLLLISTFAPYGLAAINLPANSTDNSTPLTVTPTLEGENKWYFHGYTEIVNDRTSQVIGNAYRYQSGSGNTVTMINPGSIGDWVDQFGGDKHEVIAKYTNGSIRTYKMTPPSPKVAYDRLAINDIITASGASYSYRNGKIYVTPPEGPPKVTKFEVREQPEDACYEIDSTVNIDIEVQQYLSSSNKLKYVEVYVEDTGNGTASTLKKWTDVTTDSGGKVTLTVPYKITKKDTINFYIRAYDALNRFDKDTQSLNRTVGSINPVGLKISVCGEFKTANVDGKIPYFNNKNWLDAPLLANRQPLFRVDDTADQTVLGRYRYPTLYEGNFDTSSISKKNSSFTVEVPFKNTGEDRSFIKYGYQNQPYYHLITKGGTAARNIIEKEKVTDDDFRNAYNGNPVYMRSNMPVHEVRNASWTENYGDYYYIREIAFYAGGKADNATGNNSYNDINPTWLRFMRTDWPDITTFKTKDSKYALNKPISFDFAGYEYVSEDRNKADTRITITKKGSTLKKILTNVKSDKSKKNPSKKNQGEAGYFSGTASQTFTPTEEGTYTAELYVEDSVKRYASKTITFVVGKPDEPSEPPPTSGENSCPEPKEVPKRYEHELDLIVSRLDARTVDIDTNTNTDVYVQRPDFSSSRNQAKQEFNDYIKDTEAKKEECEALIEKWEAEKETFEAEKTELESQVASIEAEKAACQATVVPEGEEGPDCSGYASQIADVKSQIAEKEKEIAEKEAQIEKGKAMLPVYDEKISLANKELDYIASNESKYSTVTPTVKLRYDGGLVGVITVSLSEGDTKRYTFPGWKVTAQEKTIMAQINEGGPYQEFKYSDLASRQQTSLGYNTSLGHVLYSNTSSNNWKDTKQYIATFYGPACPAYDTGEYFQTQTVEGVVRTVNDNGSKREIKESLTVSFTKLPRTEMRAGYGFDYTISSVYRNPDTEPEPSNATGTKSVEGYFPTIVNYQPYTRGGARPAFDVYGNVIPYGGVDEGYLVPMETKQAAVPRNETRAWILPPVAVEEYSGHVFTMNNNDYLNHEARNLNETVLTTDKAGNALHKWYTNFKDPDGVYNFRVRTYDAGVNHLNTCHNGKVVIDGVTTGDPQDNDDYVKRAVTSENPFPAGIGWNWNGHVNKLTDLSEWYQSWHKNPDKLPLNQYAKTFYLTPVTIQKINDYTKKNPDIILGESVLDEVNVPSKKE